MPDFDKRKPTAGKPEAHDDAYRAALAQLHASLPAAKAHRDPITGSPRWINAGDGFLTGPNGQGKAVSLQTSRSLAANDPHRALKGFLNEHAGLFGHDAAALNNARVTREFVSSHNGLRTVVWQQELDQIPVFESLLISHTSQNGELVNLSSGLVPDAAPAADRGTRHRLQRQVAPVISAAQAIARAAQSLGTTLLAEQIVRRPARGGKLETAPTFSASELRGDARAQLIWLPLNRDQLRLCWETTLATRSHGETYRVLVDAETGEALLRRCLTEHISNASYRVFISDSPTPFSPGYSTPSGIQPPAASRVLVVTNAVSTNASPNGWINDGDNETRGNNVDAHLDRNGDNVPDLPRPQGSPFRVFDFPLNLGQAPGTYSNAAVVQLFYWCNWMHDKLYELGFTEASGNFQVDNFGRGGQGNDALQADAQDGSDVNNADMTTLPDGSAPRMQMYVFTGPNPDRDGSLDAEVILHEYTHGLSNRRVGGGAGLGQLQARGLGEGWSDFYALALLSHAADDVDGNYALGAYTSLQIYGLTQNYYFGIRRYPYSTDLSKNPLTFKDIDSALADSHAGVPISPAFANISAAEVHAIGEVWCIALWDARANLIRKYGFAEGNQLILQLVTDGMNLSPPNPNFVEARDAILQADRVNYGGVNFNELWLAFAKRGLGASAVAPVSTTTSGVGEAFDLPDFLLVEPARGFVALGPEGGPFSPAAQTYSLTNLGANTLFWTVTKSSNWLALSSNSGTLAPGATAAAVTVSIPASAATLPMGVYTDTLVFSNASSGRFATRPVTLSVGQPDYFTEVFELHDNDLHNQSLTFTPDGSASFYAVCREPVLDFPTDPHDGKPVSLADDAAVEIALSGEARVSLYGKSTNVFVIGSNGYLSFGGGDSITVTTASHFNRQQISGLFADLNPEAGGRISWQQLFDRAVVTFEKVHEYNLASENSFQIELFFDGRIRLTHLNIAATGGLAGLSKGTGVPNPFVESDLSQYPVCSARLAIKAPGSVVEGVGTLSGQGRVSIRLPLASNLTVSLKSTLPARLAVPNTVTLLAGQTNAAFDLTIAEDSELSGTQTASITAKAPGYFSGMVSVSIIDNEEATLALSLPATVSENAGTFAGSVSVGLIATADLSVSLASSQPSKIQLPPVVTIPAGASSVPFTATVFANTEIEGDQTIQITASMQNGNDTTANVLVLDDENTALGVFLPAQASEGAGILASQGLITLSGTLKTNLIVSLFSTDPARLSVPATVLIPAGQTSAAFSPVLANNSVADGNHLVTITVQAVNWISSQAQVNILDDDSPAAPFNPLPAHLSSNNPVTVDLSWANGDGELIVNGGFESGTFLGWTMENSGLGSFVLNHATFNPASPDGPLPPFAGNFSAVSDSASSGRHGIYQDVRIPVDAGSALLRWAQQVRNHANSFASNQQFRVEIRTPANRVLALAYATPSSDPLFSNWTERSFDLTPFRGQAIRIAFVEEDALGFLNAHLDNVSVTVSSSPPVIYDVYLGTNATPGPGEFLGSTTNIFWNLPNLEPMTTYFWRIISRRLSGQTPGPIWRFSTWGVDHFAWSVVSSPQQVGQPFAVTLTAKDALDTTVNHFNGPVALSGFDGAPSFPEISISPGSANNFVQGVWSGDITVNQTAGNLFLVADDGLGHTGQGNTFSCWPVNDISLLISATPGAVLYGGNLVYTFVIYNSGPGDVSGITLRDPLPDIFTFVSVSTTSGNCMNDNGTIWCNFDLLPAGANATVSVTVTPTATGTFTNSAALILDEPDADNSDDMATVITQILPPNFLNINSVTVMEGNFGTTNAVFIVELSNPSPVPVRVDFMTTDGTAVAGSDYAATNGTIIFPPGVTNQLISVSIRGDLLNEVAEYFTVTIFNATNAIPAENSASGVILDDDAIPSITIADASVREGSAGTISNLVFNLRLSAPSGLPVKVQFATSNGTAQAGSDYAATNGSVIFSPGTTNQSIIVLVNGDDGIVEPNETLFVRLSNPTNATLARTLASGTIIDPSALPEVVVNDVTVLEGNTGVTNAIFTVSLSYPSAATVAVHYFTSDGTATAGSDYTAASGTLIFAPGLVSTNISIAVSGDVLDENNETFTFNLSDATNAVLVDSIGIATIVDDDVAPTISISDSSVNEGKIGMTTAVLWLTLSSPSGRPITVSYATQDGTALAGSDYVATNGTITFPPGVTSQPVYVAVKGDSTIEANELFLVLLANPTNASLARLSGTVTILNDDGVPGQLDHFAWNPVVSPQFASTPFAATIKAKDAQNQLVENFNGSATLGAWVKSPDVTVGSGVIPSLYPLATFSHDARCQAIYLAGELGGAKPLTALALDVTGVPGQTLNNWTIRMKHTALASFTTPNWESTGWTVVYQNDETLQATGWVNFTFSAPFSYNGTSHLMIDFSFKNFSYTYDGECRASVTAQPRSLQGSSDSAWGDPLAWTGANNPPPLVDNQIPNIKLLSTPAALAMTPVNIGPFTNGVWSGKLIMSATATNVGLIVDDGAGHLGFGNDFNVLVNSRPVLGSVLIAGNSVTLSWSAIVGRIYRVQFKDDLSASFWSNLPGDVMAMGGTATKADDFDDSPHRFYRILLLP